jgi:hypothetical protein
MIRKIFNQQQDFTSGGKNGCFPNKKLKNVL